MKKRVLTIAMIAVLGLLVGTARSAQDRYALQVPNGLAFSEFRGYEKWQTVSVSVSGDLMSVILVNPVMVDAYLAGVPGNGKPFPDGSRMAKVHGNVKKSAEASAPTTVPDTLHDVDFMVRDSKRFAGSGGWGYAQFDYDNASDAFKPMGSGADCGYACHTIVKAKDYVFTAYPEALIDSQTTKLNPNRKGVGMDNRLSFAKSAAFAIALYGGIACAAHADGSSNSRFGGEGYAYFPIRLGL